MNRAEVFFDRIGRADAVGLSQPAIRRGIAAWMREWERFLATLPPDMPRSCSIEAKPRADGGTPLIAEVHLRAGEARGFTWLSLLPDSHFTGRETARFTLNVLRMAQRSLQLDFARREDEACGQGGGPVS